MNKVTLKAKGKINLLLDVTAKRENGYHDIATIMQSVSLADVITVEKRTDGKIVIDSEFNHIVKPEDNICYKAIMLMKEEFKIEDGFSVKIKKHIPMAGGMGGGSTDAAAVMKAVNQLSHLNLSTEKLMETGLSLGADVPFCIFEKCALAHGVGEELKEITGLSGVKLAIVNPMISVSTKTVYELVDEKCELGKIDENKAVEALKEGKMEEYPFVLKNIMQSVTEEICPQIKEIIKGLKELGAVHAMMSGSGATCFGIFNDDIDENALKNCFKDYFVAVAEPM